MPSARTSRDVQRAQKHLRRQCDREDKQLFFGFGLSECQTRLLFGAVMTPRDLAFGRDCARRARNLS